MANDGAETPYKDVRALSRGIAVLEALADLGWVRVGTLASYTGIDRGTLYRLLQTLEQAGYVARRPEDKKFSLSGKVLQLADGVRREDLVTQATIPILRQLTLDIVWPSDFGIFTHGRMTIQSSSHSYSPISVHRHLVGKTRPLLRSALGIAYLAALSPAELAKTLAILHHLGGADAAEIEYAKGLPSLLEQTRQLGYAASEGNIESNISAIAVPVRQSERPIGAINLVFFRRAMSAATAAEKYLARLREAAIAIENALTLREADTDEYGGPLPAQMAHIPSGQARETG
jgi:IclR family mhp operon transcriptional activator